MNTKLVKERQTAERAPSLSNVEHKRHTDMNSESRYDTSQTTATPLEIIYVLGKSATITQLQRRIKRLTAVITNITWQEEPIQTLGE